MENEEWVTLQKACDVLKVFSEASNEIAKESVTMNASITIFNYVFDELERFRLTMKNREFIRGLDAAKEKLSFYYSKTTAPSYNVAISKLLFFHIIYFFIKSVIN